MKSDIENDSGNIVEEYTSDFTKVLGNIMKNISENKFDIEVINDKMQLRVIFTPHTSASIDNFKSEIKNLVKSMIDKTDTKNSYELDIFSDDGDVIAVVAPNFSNNPRQM